MHNQTDHVLIERRQHSSIFDVQSFRGAAKVRERLATSKQAAQEI
jgi:hypothetical protein